MNDKEYARITKILDRLGKKWFTTLGFGRWRVRVTYYRSVNEEEPKCVGACSVTWEYLDMWIKFWVEPMEDWTEKHIEEVFLHECCHGLVNEMREWTPDNMGHEERVVSQLTQAILWAKYDGRQEGKRISRSGQKNTKGKK